MQIQKPKILVIKENPKFWQLIQYSQPKSPSFVPTPTPTLPTLHLRFLLLRFIKFRVFRLVLLHLGRLNLRIHTY